MGQEKIESFIETVSNTFIGFIINFVANWFLLPAVFGIHVGFHDNLLLGSLFTLISVIRGYALRRYFNNHIGDFARRVSTKICI